MPVCHIALGGNLGPVRETLDKAIAALSVEPGIALGSVSSFFRTAAVGEGAESPFLNAACEISTALAPLALLDVLQAIESRLGRTRERHWGPRTVDLDLIFYGSLVLETPRLTLPHPACWHRRFVLDPLSEIAPDFLHPVKQLPVRALRERLLARPLRVAFAGGTPQERMLVTGNLNREFPAAAFSEWNQAGGSARADDAPAFLVWLGSSAGRSATPPESQFLELPLVPRIDATRSNEPPEAFVRHLLQSALG